MCAGSEQLKILRVNAITEIGVDMQNNSEAPGEKPVSDLTENFNSAKTIKSNELDGLLKTEKLFTIVQVTDMDNLPFVLIGDEDHEV